MKIPTKVHSRLVAGIKQFQPILADAKSRDVGEADTSTIVKDMLSAVLGYDKYSEITSEYAIRGTYCDLAIKIDGKLSLLIEVKAIGINLKDSHVKQAVDYAANQGIEWVVLTNGAIWRVYHLNFEQPISSELIEEMDFVAANPKKEADLLSLYIITKEGNGKSALDDYHAQKQAMSRYYIGATILTEGVLEVLRRELRRVSPDAKIELDDLKRVIEE
jgi:predicted type IV restriction endonuclease